ncbi:MAG: recombination regulator RecX [Legionella sp.]|nr:recombination regulator RecX [Legionella sp.]
MTKAFDCAIRLLARREHSAFELSEKLERKGFDKIATSDAIAKCQALELQSDERFVESYSRSRIRQGYGPLKITQELKQKKLDANLIFKILNQDDAHWVDHATRVWLKKNKGQVEWSFAELQKQQRFLLYRGFSSETITRVVEALEC